MWLVIEQLLRGIVLPIVLAGGLLILIGRPWRRDAVGRHRWVTPLALGLAFAAGFVAVLGWPSFPPAENWKWLLGLVLLSIPAGIGEDLARTPIWLRWVVRVVLAGLAGWLLVPQWESLADQRAGWIAALAAAVVGVWMVSAWTGRRRGNPAQTLCVIIAIAALGYLLAESRNSKLAQLAGVAGAALGAGFLVACWNRAAFSQTGAAAFTAVTLPPLALTGHFNNYGDVPLAGFILIGLAPLMLAGMKLPLLRRLSGWKAFVVTVASVLAPVGIAVFLTVRAGSGSESMYDY